MSEQPKLWIVGGMDPTGGAGVWRDVWTASRLAPELEIRAVVTAFTWQGRGVLARAQRVEETHLVRALTPQM